MFCMFVCSLSKFVANVCMMIEERVVPIFLCFYFFFKNGAGHFFRTLQVFRFELRQVFRRGTGQAFSFGTRLAFSVGAWDVLVLKSILWQSLRLENVCGFIKLY